MNQSIENVLMEMVANCKQLKLDYAVMGGIAVRVHGIPRPTYDVDFELNVDQERLEKFFDLASAQGYMIDVKLKTYLAGNQSVDVDIFINETNFQQSLMSRRKAIEFEGQAIDFVTPEDLILFKLIASRPRDLGDVADVLFVQGQLDETYMRTWAEHLEITDGLEASLAENNS